MSDDTTVAYVVTTSPLKVAVAGSSTATAAKPVAGSSYTPTVDDAVLVRFVDPLFWIIGGLT